MQVAVIGPTAFVKIAGPATYKPAADFGVLVDELYRQGLREFTFEMTDCTTMDSTFAGVLAGLGSLFSHGKCFLPDSPLRILNANPRISDSLENLGISGLFQFKSCAPLEGADFETVAPNGATKTDLTRNCLTAHRTLIALHPDNAKKFKDVTQFLAEDLKRLEGPGVK